MPGLSFEQFPALATLPHLRHAFTLRVAGVDVSHDKATSLARLDRVHHEIRQTIGIGALPCVTAEQVHGDRIGVVDQPRCGNFCFAGCDGLITNLPNVALGIYVADCCAIFLVDPVKGALGLVHSGRKGTELNITGNALAQMSERFGSDPKDVIAQLSPCIRPPHYEIDFASEIERQCRRAGVTQVHDSGTCTGCDLTRYYSYRAEKGRTGRMLAMLAATNNQLV